MDKPQKIPIGKASSSDDLLGEDFWQEIVELIPKPGPCVDIYHTSTAIIVLVEAPGLDKPERIDIRLDGDTLIIEGELPCHYPVPENKISRRERFFGHFRRQFLLPVPVSSEGISSSFSNGLFKVELSIHSPTPPNKNSAGYGPWRSKSVQISKK